MTEWFVTRDLPERSKWIHTSMWVETPRIAGRLDPHQSLRVWSARVADPTIGVAVTVSRHLPWLPVRSMPACQSTERDVFQCILFLLTASLSISDPLASSDTCAQLAQAQGDTPSGDMPDNTNQAPSPVSTTPSGPVEPTAGTGQGTGEPSASSSDEEQGISPLIVNLFQQGRYWRYRRHYQSEGHDDAQEQVSTIACTVDGVQWFRDLLLSHVQCNNDFDTISGYWAANEHGLWRVWWYPHTEERMSEMIQQEPPFLPIPPVVLHEEQADENGRSIRDVVQNENGQWCAESLNQSEESMGKTLCFVEGVGVVQAQYLFSGGAGFTVDFELITE
jgi:hypothetical protein